MILQIQVIFSGFREFVIKCFLSEIGAQVAYFLMLREHVENHERRLQLRISTMPEVLFRGDIVCMCCEIASSALYDQYRVRARKLRDLMLVHV